jgi:hypothetical protein
MMNPTLRDTPTWTAALVIEGLTAFYRSILGQTDDALQRDAGHDEPHPTRYADLDSGSRDRDARECLSFARP